MVVMAGNIDLFVCSIAFLSSMVFAYMIIIMGQDTIVTFLTVIVVLILIGIYHEVFAFRFSPPLPTSVPSFIVTSDSLVLLRGIAIVMTCGYPIKIYDYSKIALCTLVGVSLIGGEGTAFFFLRYF